MNNTHIILQNLGISSLSEMQTQACALIDNNPNVVLLSPTGTGKTLAFLLPLIRQIDTTRDDVQALILSPTRELAMQTGNVLTKMKTGVRHTCVYGGRPAMDEHRTLRSLMPHIVIGTPGRVLDHLNKGNFSPQGIKMVVVDEFDKMFELKFVGEVEQIFSMLRNNERCVLASATEMEAIPTFVGFRKNVPATLNWLDSSHPTGAEGICHFFVRSSQKDKLQALDGLLRCCLNESESRHPVRPSSLGLPAQSSPSAQSSLQPQSAQQPHSPQAIVFVNHRESAERVYAFLRTNGHSAIVFHGGLEQKDRERALALFSSGSVCTLVSTDLAARGIDVPTLQNVIHYHLPLSPEDYIHRCGRTGRWQQGGRSFLLLGPEEQAPAIDGIEFQEYRLPATLPAPARPQWTTLYIGRGKKDKLSKGDVVGFLCKAGGIQSRQIGVIRVQPHCTYAAILRSVANKVLRQIAGQKIKKMSTIIEPADKKP